MIEFTHKAFVVAALVFVLIILIGCEVGSRSNGPQKILLFNGSGTSPNDVSALKKILKENRLDFVTVNSSRLNRMEEEQLKEFRLLIVPGGNFERIGNGLTPKTKNKIRNSINNGLNYFGICAGAFFAGNSPYNGLDLTSGVRFDFYAVASQGVRKSAVEIAIAGSQALTQYWEDGPQLSGWGDIVAKYPDGTPAIVQGDFGNGGVILSGVHPEAPESWRHGMIFSTPASVSNAYAVTLITAALNHNRLEHYEPETLALPPIRSFETNRGID